MKLKELRIKAKLTQAQMAERFEIPKRTIENWEAGKNKCPGYVEKLIAEKLEEIIMNNIIRNEYGKEIEFEMAVNLMDDEIREQLHSELAPCSDQDFFNAYCKKHEEKFSEEFELAKENPAY